MAVSLKKDPKNIYHYCSLDTFHSIITYKTLRMSDISKSNDSMEIVWITRYIKNVFEEAYLKEPAKYFREKFNIKIFDELIDHYINEFFEADKFMFFVCCFSEERDLLSQWRGYADDGKGIAIGFDYSMMSKMMDSYNFAFGSVEYRERYQRSMINQHAMELINKLKNWVNDESYEEETLKQDSMDFFHSCFLNLFSKAVFMKSSFFKEEKEHRISIYDRSLPKTHYLVRGNKLVSYMDIPFDDYSNGLISEIVLGPKSKAEPKDIQNFMRNAGIYISENQIIRSGGSYR